MEEELRGVKVLVIDDSKTIRRSAENLLSKAGCDVITATDGFDALAKIADSHPEIIFVDIMMPRLDGYQTCALIKNNSEFKSTPVVMLSSKDGLFDKAKGRIVGFGSVHHEAVQQRRAPRHHPHVGELATDSRQRRNGSYSCSRRLTHRNPSVRQRAGEAWPPGADRGVRHRRHRSRQRGIAGRHPDGCRHAGYQRLSGDAPADPRQRRPATFR